jgi:uncharacterized protein (DUF433 family)
MPPEWRESQHSASIWPRDAAPETAGDPLVAREGPVRATVYGMAAEIVPGVTVDPSVAFGKPVIAGTRTPAAIVLAQLAAGIPEKELCDEYDLTRDQVRAALRYGAWLAESEVVRAVAG